MFLTQKYEDTLEYALNRWCMAWLNLFIDFSYSIGFYSLGSILINSYDKRWKFECDRIEELKHL